MTVDEATLPDELRYETWQARLLEAKDNFDQVLVLVHQYDTYLANGILHTILPNERPVYGESPAKEKARKARIAARQDAWRARSYEVFSRMHGLVACLPCLDWRVFDMEPMRYSRGAWSEVFLAALYSNPLFGYLILWVPESRQQEVTKSIMNSLNPWPDNPPDAPSPWPDDARTLSLVRPLLSWRKKRGLPASLDSLREKAGPGKFFSFDEYVRDVQTALQASVIDMLGFYREWDALWRKEATKKGIALPPNKRLDRLLKVLDMETVNDG